MLSINSESLFFNSDLKTEFQLYEMSRKLRESTKKVIAYRQEYKCAGCDKLLPPSFQVDHIIPHSISNDDSEDNLQCLCPNCHCSKTQRENIRIIKYKKLCLSNVNKSFCWFCLEGFSDIDTHKFSCSKILKKFENEEKQKASLKEDLLYQYAFDKTQKQMEKLSIINNKVDNTLNIEIFLYNFCIYINNNVFKCKNNDITISDISEAIELCTRSKKYSNAISNINIKIVDKIEDDKFDIMKNECFEYISDNLLNHIPERILNKDEQVFFILD